MACDLDGIGPTLACARCVRRADGRSLCAVCKPRTVDRASRARRGATGFAPCILSNFMAYQLTLDHPGRDTNAFYRRTLHVLSDAQVPFLVGGSHALLTYTGIVRETKDFDLFIRRADLDAALE